MNSNRTQGFTLIELLVVIAIIGILSSVVLASLNTARGKGANAAIKENLNNVRAQAEIVYDNASPNSYVTVCNDSSFWRGVTAAAAVSGATYHATAISGTQYGCSENASGWVAWAALKQAEGSNVAWCVDGTGQSKGEPATSITASTTLSCP